jgi:hypothetical protein
MTGRSSTPWPPGFIAGVSGILDHPHARVMTPESVAALGFIRHGSAFPRRAAPELCQNLPPRRAWGMPGAQCTRSLVCEVGSSKCTRVFTAVAPEITRHPRTQWFTAYFVLSPAIGLSCHRRLADIGTSARSGLSTSARLDAGVEASGPHDFAVRFSAVRLRAL